jgi:flagellar L-ring protein precursor FlgH
MKVSGKFEIIRTISLFVCIAAVFLLSGCAGKSKKMGSIINPPPAVRSSSAMEPLHKEKEYEGSLWKSNGPLSGMFYNPKARTVGDIVTIKIVETSSASNKAITNTSRDTSLIGGIDNFFGLEKKYPTAHPFLNPFGQVQGSLKSEFDGSGTTTRSGNLTAYITGRIVEEFPNGNLRIMGTREVTVNNEKQIIVLSGIIRSRDISSENIILSTYISDAKIAYSGSGIVNEKQRPGWMARVLDTVWPF